ncbi:Fc.00g027670.m01.CDS01 [Cosmosporella sp. VM-42]
MQTLRPTTCLSADSHDGEFITDKLSHYMGCVEYCEREDYFNQLPDDGKRQIKTEWRRIQLLRQVLQTSDAEKHLVNNVSGSLSAWKTEMRTEKFQKVQKWSTQRKPKRKNCQAHDPGAEEAQARRQSRPELLTSAEYNPDKDTNAYVIQYRNGVGITDHSKRPNGSKIFLGKFPNQKISVDSLLRDEEINPLGKDRSAENNHEREGSKEHLVRYFHLPTNNMKWVQDAIARYYDESDPQYDTSYSRSREKTRANRLLHRDFWRGQEHGQGSPIIHARHLRPLCEPVSSEVLADRDGSDPEQNGNIPENIVLFMPYLHWELDHKREQFATLIDQRSKAHQNHLLDEEDKLRTKRRDERRGLPREACHGCDALTDVPSTPPSKRKDTLNSYASRTEAHPDLSTLLLRFIRRESTDRFSHIIPEGPRRVDGRLVTRNRLGQLLYDAFVLYEAMNSYRDKKLIENYLLEDPALHPRRTLDQAYYWTMSNTRARDRDQVVYRDTSAKKDTLHRCVPKNYGTDKEVWEWNCHDGGEAYEPSSVTDQRGQQNQMSVAEATTEVVDAVNNFELPTINHSQSKQQPCNQCHRECRHCREDIRKVPRLVMVDQLWMWILDDRTIITCFPRRYGMNRQDSSGVYKSIRLRLEKAGSSRIHSAYDLALIIIDECSNIFFDRTKTDLRQPQMIEIFSEAIGNMAHKQTVSFNHLWNRADQLVKVSSDTSSVIDVKALHKGLLNITHEGKLQRETKDIIEELDIMIYIIKKQREVLKRFKKHAEARLEGYHEPRRTRPKEETTEENKKKLVRLQTFTKNVDEILEEADDHIEELEGLHKSAESVCKGLEHLLALKQQQASVVQAWEAIRQGEQAVKQGRAIMIFTIITIIFLPLAFMAAIFGMNNDTLKDEKMSFGFQIKLMFTISLGVIILVVIIAFSQFIRNLIWSIFYFCTNYILIQSGLYAWWLNLPDTLHRDNMVKWCEKKIKKMKDDRKRAKWQRKAEEYKQYREQWEMKQQQERSKKPEAGGNNDMGNNPPQPKGTSSSINIDASSHTVGGSTRSRLSDPLGGSMV